VVDVLQVYHRREPRDLQAAFAFYVGGKFAEAHRAGHDVRAAASVLDAVLGRYRDLPRSVRELHAQLTELNRACRFHLVEGEPVFGFGKYRGRRLKDVARSDPAYLEWMLSGSFLDDVKEIVREALLANGGGGATTPALGGGGSAASTAGAPAGGAAGAASGVGLPGAGNGPTASTPGQPQPWQLNSNANPGAGSNSAGPGGAAAAAAPPAPAPASRSAPGGGDGPAAGNGGRASRCSSRKPPSP